MLTTDLQQEVVVDPPFLREVEEAINSIVVGVVVLDETFIIRIVVVEGAEEEGGGIITITAIASMISRNPKIPSKPLFAVFSR